ncbi:MAG: polynucleotide adenylyltransferase [Clostridia bacterium]|nr:polynucleotide adenylyltransferase [Clostridia bacterium]
MKIDIPKHILCALDMLKANGHESYIVGGCVRDSLINKVPSDWDICTCALPEETASVFKNFKTILTGIKHGTVCVIIDAFPVEITTFRTDGKYIDNRHPETITFSSSLSEDLKRRDFTINAMAYSKEHGLVDFNGGVNDLKSKIIKCVGDPEKRFGEDALRIMRAIRFSAQLGFRIDDNTKKAIFSKKELLSNISAERITDEFFKLIMSDCYIDILREFEDVIKIFIPHFNSIIKDIMVKKDIRLRLAYALSSSKCNIDDVFGTLVVSKSLKNSVNTILLNQNTSIINDKYNIKKQLSGLGEELLSLVLEFKSYLGQDVSGHIDTMNKILINNECYSLKQLKVSGNNIKSLGVKDNTNIGKVLDYLLKQVISDNLPNEKEALLNEAKAYIINNKF